jgi:hypothetical protein
MIFVNSSSWLMYINKTVQSVPYDSNNMRHVRQCRCLNHDERFRKR